MVDESVKPGLPRRRGPRTGLSRQKVRSLLSHTEGPMQLALMLVYGSGLAALEALHLRVRDVDLAAREVILRRRGADRSRRVPINGMAWGPLNRRIAEVIGEGRILGGSSAPGDPRGRYLFPARAIGGQIYPLHPAQLQRALDEASARAGLRRPITCQTLRRACAAHLLEEGYDPDEIRHRLGWV